MGSGGRFPHIRIHYPSRECDLKFVYATAALCVSGVWLYALATVIYFPIRVVVIKHRSEDIWDFLTRRRLVRATVAYVISAPLLIGIAGVVFVLSGAAKASGPGGSTSDTNVDLLLLLGWIFLGAFLAAAVVALVALFVRPRLSQTL